MSTKYEVADGVAIIWICNPPLNPLGQSVRAGIMSALKRAESDPAVTVIVIAGVGPTFSAGADIKEMSGAGSSAFASPDLLQVIAAVEASPKPVVAAIAGVALGGGCEVALACHYRVAAASARFGLPEVRIGLIPGAGGTQRLPRLVPTDFALKMITTGSMVPAANAAASGLVDHVCSPEPPTPQALVAAAAAFARSRFPAGAAAETGIAAVPPRTGRLPLRDTPAAAEAACDAAAARCGPPVRGGEAAWACVEAVRAAARAATLEAGLAAEGVLFMKAIQSQQSRARRHLFLAERAAGRAPRLPVGTSLPRIASVGVVGAGTMGSGIAAALLMGGYAVTLVDAKQEALDRGIKYIERAFASLVRRGRLPEKAAAAARGRLTASLRLADAAVAPMVIEAVFENMALKQDIFRKLDAAAPPATVLCTNTSTLSVDAIAGATSRPDRVMGMHFFSPAHIMPLVECVRGAATAPQTTAAVLAIARRMPGKVAVLVGNCDGFVGNRMLRWYSDEAAFLMEDGASPRQIDAAARAFGMAIGPLEMADVAGNDISWLIRKERGQLDPLKRDPAQRYSALGDRLCEKGRMGQKTGKGWYRYEAGIRTPKDDPEVAALIDECRLERQQLLAERQQRQGNGAAPEAGAVGPRQISEEEIVHRLFYPLINEGFRILEEGIAERPSDIDVVWAHGYSWPRWRGGPMFWADEMTPALLRRELERYGAANPDVAHWQPAPLLRRLADSEETLAGYYARREVGGGSGGGGGGGGGAAAETSKL